jgi:outer membrane immunogenic protein
MRSLLIGAVASLGLTMAASAADYARPAPPMAPIFTWTGFYIGANAGGIWADGSIGQNCFDVGGVPFGTIFCGGAPLFPGGRDESSWLAGGQIGYNYQFRGWGGGNWVFGVEADGQATDLTRRGSIFLPGAGLGIVDPVGTFANNLSFTATHKIDAFGTVRGRLGWAFDRLLIYGTAGAIFANVTTTYSQDRFFTTPFAAGGFFFGNGVSAAVTPLNVGSASSHDVWVPGWVAGGGIEYAFWNNVSLKVEAMYYELQPTHAGARELVNFNINFPAGSRSGTDIGTHGFLVRGGINWRFWGM